MNNLYEIIPDKYNNKPVHYDNYDKIHMNVPFMMTISGGTGTGKTNSALNYAMNINAFDCYRIFAKNYQVDPLYKAFIDELKDASNETHTPLIYVETDIEKLPPIQDMMSKDGQEHSTLIIVDDMINEANQEALCDYFIAARKYNTSCMYLSQSYFAIPIMIRKQQHYAVISHVHARDLERIIPEMNKTELDASDVIQLYRHIMKNKNLNAQYRDIKHVFMMDGITHDPHYAFRDGWNVIPNFDQIIKSRSAEDTHSNKRKRKRKGQNLTDTTDLNQKLLTGPEHFEPKPVRVRPINDTGDLQHRNTLSILDQIRIRKRHKQTMNQLFS